MKIGTTINLGENSIVGINSSTVNNALSWPWIKAEMYTSQYISLRKRYSEDISNQI